MLSVSPYQDIRLEHKSIQADIEVECRPARHKELA